MSPQKVAPAKGRLTPQAFPLWTHTKIRTKITQKFTQNRTKIHTKIAQEFAQKVFEKKSHKESPKKENPSPLTHFPLCDSFPFMLLISR